VRERVRVEATSQVNARRTQSRVGYQAWHLSRAAQQVGEEDNACMPPAASYDEIATWYETEFLPRQRESTTGVADPLGITRTLQELLGSGEGRCIEIGCGTGVHAAEISALGWTPIGVDLSAGMLEYARGRLPIAQGNAESLPFPAACADAIASIMAHTDMSGYLNVLDELARVLRPGGALVHVGVHPCFCGGFADRSNPDAIVIRTGYLDANWSTDSWTTQGVRDKVGASHWPMATLLNGFTNSGLTIEQLTEGGEPTPVVLGIRARRAR
jgi:SAM-dependent methyltransferase